MSELDFFKSYFNELNSKIDNKEFIAKLEDLIVNKKCSEANYKRLLEEEFSNE